MNTSKAKEWSTCEPGPSFFIDNETMPTSSSTELERARLYGFITGVIVATLIFTLAVFLMHRKTPRTEQRMPDRTSNATERRTRPDFHVSVEAITKSHAACVRKIFASICRPSSGTAFGSEKLSRVFPHWPSGRCNSIHPRWHCVKQLPDSSPAWLQVPHSNNSFHWHGATCRTTWEFMHPPPIRTVCPNGIKSYTGEHTCLTSTQHRSQETSARTQKPFTPRAANQ